MALNELHSKIIIIRILSNSVLFSSTNIQKSLNRIHLLEKQVKACFQRKVIFLDLLESSFFFLKQELSTKLIKVLKVLNLIQQFFLVNVYCFKDI